jgi:hypothetical protein
LSQSNGNGLPPAFFRPWNHAFASSNVQRAMLPFMHCLPDLARMAMAFQTDRTAATLAAATTTTTIPATLAACAELALLILSFSCFGHANRVGETNASSKASLYLHHVTHLLFFSPLLWDTRH